MGIVEADEVTPDDVLEVTSDEQAVLDMVEATILPTMIAEGLETQLDLSHLAECDGKQYLIKVTIDVSEVDDEADGA